MSDIAATAYVLCVTVWNFIVLGTCTYIVFWKDHSGWWYLLAMMLVSGSSSGAAKIKGTWRPEMDA